MNAPWILHTGPYSRTELYHEKDGSITLLIFHGHKVEGETYTRDQARELADALTKACNTVTKEAT